MEYYFNNIKVPLKLVIDALGIDFDAVYSGHTMDNRGDLLEIPNHHMPYESTRQQTQCRRTIVWNSSIAHVPSRKCVKLAIVSIYI